MSDREWAVMLYNPDQQNMSNNDSEERLLIVAKGNTYVSDNSICTSKYTVLNFVPLALVEQFRRFANVYFATQGILMLLGLYTDLFVSVVMPWSIIAPFSIVLILGLLKEAISDIGRHRSDAKTNNHKCTVLTREDDLLSKNGKADKTVLDGKPLYFDLPHESNDDTLEDSTQNRCAVVFEKVRRRDIYAGDIVLVRNRDVIPADLVVLASGNVDGVTYVETSSIDGETNLKLRKSVLPSNESKNVEKTTTSTSIAVDEIETLETVTTRIAAMTVLGYPLGVNAIANPVGREEQFIDSEIVSASTKKIDKYQQPPYHDGCIYVSNLTSEQPNASVNTFSGRLTIPPTNKDGPSLDIPLDAENILLRGAKLRNTEWAIGIACFTGKDTKLAKNSLKTPSKFSRLDDNVNIIVFFVLCILLLSSFTLAAIAVVKHKKDFDDFWYLGFNRDETQEWPYLPEGMAIPEWKTKNQSLFQFALSYITLLYNIIPLSAFITLEMITLFMVFLVTWDINMYHKESDSPAIAQSNIVSDLGQVGHIFSDKTGTLTQNVMRFKRCSVDGTMFGEPLEKSAPMDTSNDQPNYMMQSFQPLCKLLQSSHYIGSNSRSMLTFNTEMFCRVMSLCHTVVVEKDIDVQVGKNKRQKHISLRSEGETIGSSRSSCSNSSHNGAPIGFQYQAESPDEAALVQAASIDFGFQLLSRDSASINVACSCPSLLADENISKHLKEGTLTPLEVSRLTKRDEDNQPSGISERSLRECQTEKWKVLAINKFDSDRKRMSIIVRSPPELGSILFLFCKGADSSMLDDTVVENTSNAMPSPSQGSDVSDQNHNILCMLSHLGVFASEGLRTLVLAVRVLSEEECAQWLIRYKEASSAIRDRHVELGNVAKEIETNMHIVGATAIEDKLQVGVPETIDKLMDAGLKLWVLTGDKRETAVEIGYSTKVLTPKMSVTEITNGSPEEVRGQLALEFMSFVKWGRLTEYQLSSLTRQSYCSSLVKQTFWFLSLVTKNPMIFCNLNDLNHVRTNPLEHFQKTRQKAKKLASQYLTSKRLRRELKEMDERKDSAVTNKKNERGAYLKDLTLSSYDSEDGEGHQCYPLESFQTFTSIPYVFSRAETAAELIEEGGKSNHRDFIQEKEDILSSISFNAKSVWKTRKTNHTILEKAFANDCDVRKGHLSKHVNSAQMESEEFCDPVSGEIFGQRALVIEGSSLPHLFGDPLLEQMLFSVANSCDSVIACRVTPKQKAMMVDLVKRYDHTSPVTLAIGDGANDVGMIQEAHVGIGISGLEGQQAANSADFAIGQFRFLQDLLLVHGRWNLTRLSRTVLYSFYKNGVLSGLLILFASESMYSGTPLFDIWIMAFFNFVCAVPIMLYGAFDRDLEKDYVKKNPSVYVSGPAGEELSSRVKWRWATLCLFQIFLTLVLSKASLSLGGTITTSSTLIRPGDGEGGDLVVYGTTIFTTLVFTLVFKVLYECRSLIHGEWPPCNCKKTSEGFLSRIAYTWVGVFWLSIVFYFGLVYGLQCVGYFGASMMSPFVGASDHVYFMRPITWIVALFIPISVMIPDVGAKMFANMNFPSQIQIHMEIQAEELRAKTSHSSEVDEQLLRMDVEYNQDKINHEVEPALGQTHDLL